jgi:hypothetical protein
MNNCGFLNTKSLFIVLLICYLLASCGKANSESTLSSIMKESQPSETEQNSLHQAETSPIKNSNWIKYTYPSPNEEKVPVNSDIIIAFNQKMDPNTIDAYVVEGPGTYSTSNPITGSYTYIYKEEDNTLYLKLKESRIFPRQQDIVVHVSSTIENEYGDTIDTDYSFNFRYAEMPPQLPGHRKSTKWIKSTQPLHGDESVLENTKIKIYFAQDMDEASLTTENIQFEDGTRVGTIQGPTYGMKKLYDPKTRVKMGEDYIFEFYVPE